MMGKKYLLMLWACLFAAIAITIVPSASAIDYSQYKDVVMKVNVSSNFSVVAQQSDYSIDYVRVNLSFFPRKTQFQNPLDIQFQPEAVMMDNAADFEWKNPAPGNYRFSAYSTVEVPNDFVKVRTKEPFPVTGIPDDILVYTQPSKTIDSDNEDIQNLASQLAEGEDDQYVVAHKFASWVEENINYSLDTLTAESSQKASWVLANKRGVCDELSSLFIAMCRSAGIPARYASGVAYTDYNSADDWGPHAWAEVYFPGYGWVPFDTTYRQFGIIDPSHIVLKESVDSDEPSTDFEWKSRDVDVTTSKLDINVQQAGAEGNVEENLRITSSALKDDVGFGSYNLVEASIVNDNDYYYSTEISLAQVNDISIIDPFRRHVLLLPHEQKRIFWRVQVSPSLQRNYEYTIPLIVYTTMNSTAESSFAATDNADRLSAKYVETAMDDMASEEQKTYSRNVDLSCEPEKQDNYYYEEPIIDCSAKNTGNAVLSAVDICIYGAAGDKKCRTVDLAIAQERTVNFTLDKQDAGNQTFRITASNDLVSKSIDFYLNILDDPKIAIDETYHPDNVSFNDKFNISFVLEQKSYSVPQQLTIKIFQNGQDNMLKKDNLEGSQGIVMAFPADDMNWGKNEYNVTVEYYDKNGKKFSESEKFDVSLTQAAFTDRAYIYFNQFLHWVEGFF